MRPSAQQLQNEYAFVALGSNLGDSRELLRAAISKLQEFSDERILQSSLWESEPVDSPPGSPTFLNAVIALRPRGEESPESLLSKLHALEKEFGRVRTGMQNEARQLDLDLITFGQKTCQSSSLILPHPRAHLRRFVLEPIAEISPEFVLPGQRRSVSALLQDLPPTGYVSRLTEA
jgi:2-amino-4-hydroxy-6-hydroxymethyldihydropteridine diphosphokinase